MLPHVGGEDFRNLGRVPRANLARHQRRQSYDGDGAFPGAQFPNCVYNLALAAPAGTAQTLTFIVQGDGTTDAFFAGAPTGANTPTPVVPAVVERR